MSDLKDLEWRYATKKYDSTKVVSEDKVQQILEATRLTPTSSGLQQFRVILVTDPELKKQMVPIAWGQQQVEDCSHVLVFAAWDRYTAERIDETLKHTAIERGLPENRFSDYAEQLKKNYLEQSAEENFEHTSKQAYIGLGFAMAEAAKLKVDTTPMEGFMPEAVDELLGLKELGLRSVLLLPLGYRDADKDWLAPMKKVRIPMEEFVITR